MYGAYRYGFNGKENDNEVKGQGNQQDYGMRIYDPRVGRFLSVDPLQKEYPWFTPFQFAGNNPVANIDLDGLENYSYHLYYARNSKGESVLRIQFDKEEEIGAFAMLGRLNTGPVERHYLYHDGKLVGEFTSFQELKTVCHGKTVAQLKTYQSDAIVGAQIVAGAQMQQMLAESYEQPPQPVFNRPTQQKKLVEDAQAEEMAQPSSTPSPGASVLQVVARSSGGNRSTPAGASNTATQSTEKGNYNNVGGHHVHQKAAFKANMSYDLGKGFSISQSYMNQKGWNHQAMTNKQRELFKELNTSGRPNTLTEHTNIAVKSLQAGGASLQEARSLVAESLNNLRNQGVTVPTNIPWYK
jgi:RHS repeat-associated protein